MPLTIVTGPANSAKAQLVLDRYCAVLSRSPILVVPRVADAEHYRRELAARGVVFGVRVEPFSGLMREIARRGTLSSRPLGEHAREALLSGVVAAARLDVLARGAVAPGFVPSLARFIAELELRRISPGRFSAALRSWAPQDAPRRRYTDELAGLYAAYRRRLDGLGRLDAELHAAAALDAIALAGERWGGTPVFCYGFDDLDRLQLDAIETLAHKVGAPVTVSLPGEPGRVAFAGRAATLETLRPGADEVVELAAQGAYYEEQVLFALERTLFERPSAEPAGDAVRLLEGGDERAEAELVAAEVAQLVAQGFAPADIAVVSRSAGPFAELLAQALAEVGIASSTARRAPLHSSSVGRGLLALLRCAIAGGDGADLVSWLSVPGVVGLEHAVESFEARLRRDAIGELGPARAIWEREHGRLDALDRLVGAAGRDQASFLDCVASELDGLFAARWERVAALVPAWEAAALSAARRALSELAELVRGPGGLPGGAAAVLRSLEAVSVELAPPDGEAVLISDALSIRARRVRALFICAVQEGVFPAVTGEQRFLGSTERSELARASGLVLGDPPDGLASERYLFYALCSRPTARLRVSWHTAGDDGETALASLFLDDLRDAFDDDLFDRRRVRAAGAIGWGGDGPRSPFTERRELALAGPRRLGGVIGTIDAPERLAALRGHASHSPSALEKWADCPVAWLVERALRAGDLAGENVWMARGSRAHRVLASVFTELRERPGAGRLEQSTLPLALELLDDALAAEARRPLSERPGVDRSEQRRLRLDLGRYLEFAARRASTHRFWHAELAFGLPDSSYPSAELADGLLSLCGSIDRIDRDPQAGTVIVYDYKTGRGVVPAALWEKERRFQQALYMRAAEQLLGVQAVGGLYQPVRRDLRPRGAIRDDADPQAAFVATDRLDADGLEELIDRLVLAALEAARELDRGALEPRPGTCSADHRCRFPTICRCEAR